MDHSARSWTREVDKLVWYDPIQIPIFHTLIVIIPKTSNTNFQSYDASTVMTMQTRHCNAVLVNDDSSHSLFHVKCLEIEPLEECCLHHEKVTTIMYDILLQNQTTS